MTQLKFPPFGCPVRLAGPLGCALPLGGADCGSTAVSAVGEWPVHACNIHERRPAAAVARALPLLLFAASAALSVLGAAYWPVLLLALCAVYNVAIFAMTSWSGVCCLLGAVKLSA